MKTRIMGELKKVFRPEFLNRIDEVIVFHKLQKDEIKEIVDLLLRADPRVDGRARAVAQPLRRREGLPGREGLGPGDGRPAAAPRDPALHRGPALGRGAAGAEMEPGSTIEVEKAASGGPDDGDREVDIKIIAPSKAKKRQAVGVGAKGEARRGRRARGRAATLPRCRRSPRSCRRSRTRLPPEDSAEKE